ncbi:MAG: hypothetical protein ABIT96_10870 [Ferruginibacter sp.]
MVGKINNVAELDAVIVEFEKRKVIQEALLISQWHETKESIKPINLLKDAAHRLTDSNTMLGAVIKGIGGLSMGFLTKNLILGHTTSLPGKILGTALNLTTTGTVYSNAEKLKAYGVALYHNFIKKPKKSA